MFQGDAEELEGILGNQMDDAYKSARSRVCLSGSRSGTHLWFAVEDDGPGIAQPDREEVRLRGRRIDETWPAPASASPSCAISPNCIAARAESSDLGGLCASLEFPATAPPAGSGPGTEAPMPGGR